MSKSFGGSRRKEDLGDTTKWGLVDMVQFGQVLKTFEEDIQEMKEKKEELRAALRDLDKGMIKGTPL